MKRAIAAAALMLMLCYAPILRGMVRQWSQDEDMGHGFLVPFAILGIVWSERKRWQAVGAKPSAWGLPLLGAGAFLQAGSVLGAGLFVGSAGLLVSIAGLVVWFGGLALLRAWAFPFMLSLFLLPKLAIVYNLLTLPLQLMASRTAAAMLWVAGIGVLREGNLLTVHGHPVYVAEACDGIRYLLPLGFTAAVIGYLTDRRIWVRLALFGSAIPLAILANAARVAAAASMPSLDAGTPHLIAGWLIFVLCLASLFFLRRLLSAMFRLSEHSHA